METKNEKAAKAAVSAVIKPVKSQTISNPFSASIRINN